MGNSTSQRSISVVNDSLVAVVESSKPNTEKVTQKSPEIEKRPEERIFVNREEAPSKEVHASPEEQLKAAIGPFKRLSRQQPVAPAMPAEQKVLIDCFKKNPGNSLVCVKEIQNFTNYVNKVQATKPQP